MVLSRNKPKLKRMTKRDMSRNRLETFRKEVETDSHIIPISKMLAFMLKSLLISLV